MFELIYNQLQLILPILIIGGLSYFSIFNNRNDDDLSSDDESSYDDEYSQKLLYIKKLLHAANKLYEKFFLLSEEKQYILLKKIST